MNTYPIVDADAHMFEPPDLWTKRIDAPFRDRAPRIVEGLNGKKGLFFVCEGLPPFRVSGAFAAGQKFDRSFLETGMESAPAGGWDPAARLKDMDLDGVASQILYSTMAFTLSGSAKLNSRRPASDHTTTGWRSSVAIRPSVSADWD